MVRSGFVSSGSEEVVRNLKIGGIYRHYKGDFYLIEALARDSDSLEDMVVYRSLYGDGQLWVRPYAEFMGKIDGQRQRYRFELQELSSVREEI